MSPCQCGHPFDDHGKESTRYTRLGLTEFHHTWACCECACRDYHKETAA